MAKWNYSKDNPAFYKAFKPLKEYSDKIGMRGANIIVYALIIIIIMLIIRFLVEI